MYLVMMKHLIFFAEIASPTGLPSRGSPQAPEAVNDNASLAAGFSSGYDDSPSIDVQEPGGLLRADRYDHRPGGDVSGVLGGPENHRERVVTSLPPRRTGMRGRIVREAKIQTAQPVSTTTGAAGTPIRQAGHTTFNERDSMKIDAELGECAAVGDVRLVSRSAVSDRTTVSDPG